MAVRGDSASEEAHARAAARSAAAGPPAPTRGAAFGVGASPQTQPPHAAPPSRRGAGAPWRGLGAGHLLDRDVAAALVPGSALPPVRVHTGPAADAHARLLGAEAVAVGTDVLFAAGRYAPHTTAGRALLAHELTHVARQSAVGRVRVQASPDEVLHMTVLPQWAAHLGETDLTTAIGLLIGQLEELGPTDATRTAALENLLTLGLEADERGLEVATTAWEALQRHGGALATPGEVADLEAVVDVTSTLLENQFHRAAGHALDRLAGIRRRLPFLTADVVVPMRHRLRSAMETADALVALHKSTPDGPPAPPTGITDPQAIVLATTLLHATIALQNAIVPAADAVAGGEQAPLAAAARTAQENYLDAFTANITYAISSTAAHLPTTLDVPRSEYLETLDVWPNRWGGHRETWARFRSQATTVAAAFDALGSISDLHTRPVGQRVSFLLEKGDAALALLRRAQALQLAYGAIAYSAAVRYETWRRYQMNWDDAHLDGALAGLAEQALDQLESRDGPGESALARLQPRLERRIEEAKARFDQLETLDAAVMWAANIVAILAGVGLMRLSIAALGRLVPWVAGEALAPAAVRFVVGSLAFTTGSTVARGGLTGQWPTAGGFAAQAGLDLVTFGLIRGAHVLVGARYATGAVGYGSISAGMRAAPPVALHAASFGVLWAWASTLTLVETPGALDATTVARTIASTGARTALDLVVLHMAGQLLATPTAPTTDVDVTAARQWETLRTQGRGVGGRLQEWLRGADRDLRVLERLLREAEGVILRARDVAGRLYGLDRAQRAALDEVLGEQLRMLENLRQGARLGVEQVGEAVWRYRGTVEDLEVYLGRLRQAGAVESVMRGRAPGVVEVRFADGRLAFFYPEGGRAPVIIDATAESATAAAARTAAPDLAPAVRTSALVHLRALPPGEAGRVALALPPGGGGPLLTWLARPDVGALLTQADGFPAGERLRALAADPAAQGLVLGLRPADLQAWWRARPRPEMTVAEFVAHLRGLESFRGTLALADPAEAAQVAARFAQTVEGRDLVPAPPATGMSIGPMPQPGTPTTTSTSLRTRIAEHLAGQGLTGQTLLEFRAGGRTWVVRFSGPDVARLWRFGDGTPFVELDLTLTGEVAQIRAAVADAEQLATMDRTRANERLRSVERIVRSLDALRFTRDPRLAGLRDLLERARPDRFAAPTTPAVAGVPTRSESLGRWREAILARAERMGLPRDPAQAPSAEAAATVRAVEALRVRNPRGASRPDTLAVIEAEAAAAEAALHRTATSALDRAVGRLGADAVARARRGRLARLSDVEVGEVVEALRGRPNIGEAELRGFLHAAHPPGGVSPVPVARILARAPTAAERNRAMDAFGRLVDGGVTGAHEVLRQMVGSRTSWRGGMFAFDIVLHHVDPRAVLALEVRESVPDPLRPRDVTRVYDVVLRAGSGALPAGGTLELKDWSMWFEETLRSPAGSPRRSQFERDVLLRTSNLANPAGLAEMGWVFRGPGPAIAGTTNPAEVYTHIRGVMRSALDTLATEFGLARGARQELLDAFDANPRIIQILDVDASRTARPVRRLAPDPEL